MQVTKNVHILMMGKNTDHAIIGIRKMDCDVAHIITSTEMAKEIDYKSMMDEWANELGIKTGGIHTIPNSEMFSTKATAKIVEAVLSIVREESNQPLLHIGPQDDENDKKINSTKRADEETYCEFFIGFTGGTNLMAGAAVHAANVFSATPYYIAKVPGSGSGEGEPVTLASIEATSFLSNAPSKAITELIEYPTGKFLSLNAETTMTIILLKRLHLASINKPSNPENPRRWTYEITEEGSLLLKIIAERRSLIESDYKQNNDAEDERGESENVKVDSEERDGPPDSSDPIMGTLVHSLITVTQKQVPPDDELLKVLMERWNLEGRAEVWERDNNLTLRISFINTEDESSGPSLYRFNEERIEVNNDLLVRMILDISPTWSERRRKEIARVISGDNKIEMMTYYAKMKFESIGFFFDNSQR